MNATPGSVVSVQIGTIAPLGPRAVPSGFVKRPVSGRVMATPTGLDGDEIADHSVHGGPDKAVYGYGAGAYPQWCASFPALADRFVPGSMGENLTIAGFDETNVHIGDRVRVGGALLEVSEPRQPCFKLALAFDEPKLVRAMTRSGLCGWYYRTLEAGRIAAGDPVEWIARPNPDWPIRRFFEVITARAQGREVLAEMLAMEGLSAGWKIRAIQELAQGPGRTRSRGGV